MFVKNEIMIDRKKIFPCKSSNLQKFLTITKGIPFISRVLDSKDNKYIWYFMRTDDLADALVEWKNNKDNGTLAYAKPEPKEN